MKLRSLPPIHCAQCGVHVDAVEIQEDVRDMRIHILVRCHGKAELMCIDKIDFLQVMERRITGVAFENKLEDHSDERKTTDQIETPGPSVPSKAMALRGV